MTPVLKFLIIIAIFLFQALVVFSQFDEGKYGPGKNLTKKGSVQKNLTKLPEKIEYNEDEKIVEKIQLLKTSLNPEIIKQTIVEIGYIGNPAVPYLIEDIDKKYKSSIPENKISLIYEIDALAKIGREAKDAVPLLTEILQTNENKPVADSVIRALGAAGIESKDAVPYLFDLLGQEQNESSYQIILFSIHNILQDLIDKNDFASNDNIFNAYENNKTKIRDEGRQILEDDVKNLKFKLRLFGLEVRQSLKEFSAVYQYFNGVWVFIGVLIVGWIIIYFLHPLLLISIHEKVLVSTEIGFLSFFKIPAQVIIAPLIFRPRILDAWIGKHVKKANERFFSKQTVKERKTYVPVGIFLENDFIPDFCVEDLDEVLSNKQARILIEGEGGIGKTSLACEIARWMMLEKKEERLFEDYIALPVFLEEDLSQIEPSGFQREIISQLSNLIDSENQISPVLLKELLKRKRLVVIIDGMSELSEETRSLIISGISDVSANAVIFTSRNDETLGNLSKETIEPTRIKGNQLASFVDRYMVNIAKRELFDDDEFFEGCKRLSVVVGEREITALLAKLFVEQMVAKKEGSVNDDLPRNIPELMRQSIKILNKKSPLKGSRLSDIIKVSKIIAWECLKKDYRPLPADREKVKKSLSNVSNGEEILNYLENKLKLIETRGMDEDKISFRIDPLAEYLAAMYLIDVHSNYDAKWEEFFDTVTANNSTDKVRGFLLAVYDCCIDNENVPTTIIEKLKDSISKS